jgi:hypothetical protein
MSKGAVLSLSLLAVFSLAAGHRLTAQSNSAAAVPQTAGRTAVPAKLPRVDVQHGDFGSAAGCPNSADPIGEKDSTCAINAAVAYALTESRSGEYPAIYIPLGRYKITAPIRVPCQLHVIGDGVDATAIQQMTAGANVLTVYPSTLKSLDPWLCSGSVRDLTLQGNGHTSTGSLLEVINSAGYKLESVKLYNSGGRGLNLQGSSERMESNDLQIDAVRWSLIMGGTPNEDHFFKTNIEDPGAADDGYCFGVNCTNGVYAGPNQGPGGTPTAVSPDTHSAIWMGGSNVGFYGGSIKPTMYQGGIQTSFVEAGMIANFYFEGFPMQHQLRVNPSITEGGLLPMTTLTAALSGTEMVVPVASTAWFPDYVNDPADAHYLHCTEYDWIMPKDFEWGNTSGSAYVPGVKRNQYELVCLKAMAGDGKMYIDQRNSAMGGFKSTAPAGTAWPAGSIVHMVLGTGSYGGGLTVLASHMESNASSSGARQTSFYKASCDDTNDHTCAEVIAGFIPDGYFFNPQGSSSGINNAGVQMTLINDSFWGLADPLNALSGNGYLKVHNRASITVVGTSGSIAPKGETSEVAAGQATLNGTSGPYVMAVQYATGATAMLSYSRPDTGLYLNPRNSFFEQAMSGFDPVNLGANPGSTNANGHQFANSSCWYDVGSSPSATHAQNRFCMKGGPSLTGTNAGWEYDVWNGKQWSNAFQLRGASDGTADYLATGNGVLGSPGKTLIINASKLQINATSVTGLSGNTGRNAPASYIPTSYDLTSVTHLPAKVCGVSLQNQAAAISPTTLCDVPATGDYQVIVNLYPTTSGNGTAGSVAALVSCPSVAGNPTVGGNNQLNLANPDGAAGQAYFLHCMAGGALTYTTRASAISSGAAYGLDLSVIRVQ